MKKLDELKDEKIKLIAPIADDSEKLIDYKEILDKLQATTQMGIWEVDLETNTLIWSDVARQIVEVAHNPTVEEAVNFYPEGVNRDKVTVALNEAIEKGKGFDVEVQVLTSKGNLKWVRAVAITEFEDGKCKRLYGLYQDIDQRVKHKLELQRQKELFRQTFEFAPNGMALVSLEGKWLQVNQKVCSMLGYSKEELLQLTIQELTYPDDLDIDKPLLKELLKGKRDRYETEKRYFSKNNELVWVALSVSLLKDDSSQPLYFVSQLTDITEKKRLLKTTLAQNKRLLNFAHIVSHNLRSHTSNFSMLLAMMKMENPKLMEDDFFPLLLQSSSNLQETLSYLTDIVAMQNEVKENMEALNLYEYIEKAISSIQILVSSTQAKIENHVGKGIMVEGLPAYLESIILNFITNSIKYRHLRREPVISIYSEEDHYYSVFCIKDNGLGIDLNKHGKKLFGMYKTFHDKEDARGIGLFIAKNQIEALGGKVEVKSEVNKGTTFKIYLKNAKV